MTLDNLYPLDQIQPLHRSLVGDEAFYLGLLQQRGYPIVSGVVVSATAFQNFLETIHWLEPLFADLPNSSLHLDVDNPRQLQAIAQQMRQAVQATPLSEDLMAQLMTIVQAWDSTVILRPSVALQPGLDPTLSSRTVNLLEAQVCRVTTETIASSLKQAWAELFRAKSLLYWQRLGIQPQQICLAVLVQPLRSAIGSGDVYLAETQLEIRATWGMGHALSNGEVIPDLYQIHLQTGSVQTQQLGSKTHAYQIATEVQASNPMILTQASCLQLYQIKSNQQQQYVLNSSQLQDLIRLTQQVSTELGPYLRLEWMLIEQSSSAHAPIIQLAQVLPGSLKAGAIAPTPSHFNSTVQLAVTPSLNPNMLVHESMPLHEPTTLLLKGIAAAAGKLTGAAWVVSDPITAADIPPGQILVMPLLTPDWLSHLKRAAGLITEQGGMTSHGALVARELGIPAVVGTANATRLIQTGDRVVLDGDRGEVHRIFEHQLAQDPSTAVDSPPNLAVTRPNATLLLVNLSQLDSLPQLTGRPIDGVGLLRGELMLMEILAQYPQLNRPTQNYEELIDHLSAQIQQFAHALNPRPVFYRSLDLRAHEYRSLRLFSDHLDANLERADLAESNPLLGQHGALSYQINPAPFLAELTALRRVQQSGYTNVNLLLPFVRTVEEFSFCRALVMQAGLTQNPDFQLWIMAEVPSVLFLLPDYVEAGVQGISIGSNDLTQLLLAIDRDLPPNQDRPHPAVLRAIQQLIETAQTLDIPCSICGQLPSQYPELIDSLIRWGITSISVSPDAIEPTYQAIARSEQKILLDAARQQLKRQQ
jgi:pyruvate, water dikinase